LLWSNTIVAGKRFHQESLFADPGRPPVTSTLLFLRRLTSVGLELGTSSHTKTTPR
jgi:hypothetical protein